MRYGHGRFIRVKKDARRQSDAWRLGLAITAGGARGRQSRSKPQATIAILLHRMFRRDRRDVEVIPGSSSFLGIIVPLTAYIRMLFLTCECGDIRGAHGFPLDRRRSARGGRRVTE